MLSKTLIVLMFVALCLVLYMYETRVHTLWEEHRLCGCLNIVQKRIFLARCSSREKIYNEKLNNSCYYYTLLW
jgi:hypothetical protein